MLESCWAPRRLILRLSSAAPLHADRCVRAPLRSCSTSGSHIEPAGWDWLLNSPVKRWCRSTEGEEKGRGRDLCIADDSAQCSEDLCVFTFPGALTPSQLLLRWLRGGGGLAVQDFPSCLWERGQVLSPVLLEKGREKYNTRAHYRQEKKNKQTQIDVPGDWHWGLFWLLKVTSRSCKRKHFHNIFVALLFHTDGPCTRVQWRRSPQGTHLYLKWDTFICFPVCATDAYICNYTA